MFAGEATSSQSAKEAAAATVSRGRSWRANSKVMLLALVIGSECAKRLH